MPKLTDVRVVDPVLTTLALGYSNNEMVAEALFPIVTVNKEAGKVPKFGKDAFRLYNTLRALRAKSNRLEPGTEPPLSFACEEHDLEYPIDYREAAEALYNLRKIGALTVQDAIMLIREYMAATKAQDLANYSASNKVVLSGEDQFTDKVNSDPIGVVEDGKEGVSSKIGKEPNTMVIGPATLKSLKQHPQLIEKIKYSMKGVITIALLKEIFEIENLVVGKAVYADDDDAFQKIWGDNMILAYVPKKKTGAARSVYEPSYGYTFRLKKHPSVDRRMEGGKVELIRNTDNFDLKIVGADAGYLISDTNG
jgi:hypothetical protein